MTEGRIRLGAEIQRRRKQLGLTQEELAQRMDVSRQSVTKWETGQSAPDLDRLVQLGEVLKISLDELLKGPSDNADDNWNENEGEHAARDSAEEPCLHADPAPVCRESAFPSSLSFFLRLTGGLLLFVGLAGLLALWVFSVLFPVQIPGGNGSSGSNGTGGTSSKIPEYTYTDFDGETPQYPLTTIEQVRQEDGSIGTLKIPAISLNVTAYDGDTFAAMKKGVGHIASTSCWNGNVSLVGHNRGTSNYFGKLKKLKPGDEMSYTTKLGTRTYVVDSVSKISDTDWSKLQYTSDNRLTLITCVEDVGSQRLCVQAVEKR